MKHSWPSLTALGLSAVSAACLVYWGGQDKQGQFHAEYLTADGNLGTSIFFIGPYLLLALAAAVTLPRRAPAIRLLALAAILCGVGVLGAWLDHVAYLQTPPGRETIPVLGFLAAILAWTGSAVVLLAVLVGRARASAGSPTG